MKGQFFMVKHFAALMLMLLLVAGSALAQQAPPPQVNAALADLSSRLAISPPLTVGNLDRWEWSQSVYPDSSLGCAQAGQTYTTGQYVGYRFLLTYQGVTYDYRVSGDQTIVILCNNEVLTETVIPAECVAEGYAIPRLRLGRPGRVETGGVNNLIRDIAGQSGAVLGEIPPGGEFTVIAGPSCAFGIVWWRVQYNNITGWTAESVNGEYFLEPLNPDGVVVPTPQTPDTPSAISAANLDQLVELPLPAGDTGALQAWSPDNTLLALAARGGSNGVWIYDLTASGTPRRQLLSARPVTALAFSPDSTRLAVATDDGTLTVWSLDTNTPQAVLTGAANVPVTVIAYSTDGTLIATGDSSGVIRIWEPALNLQRVTLQAFSVGVASLSFSPDGTHLVATGTDGAVRLWTLASAAG